MANPIIAAVLSLIISGWGLAYAGDVKRGIMFFVIAIVLAIILALLFGAGLITYIIAIIYNIYVAYDAYKIAQ